MSLKQDGTAPRTAADLERKYNFGRTFAEVYGLISDAQKAADEAKNAFEGLDHEEIFNLLTNYGEWQGIYRDDAGDVYINASYIKSGKLAAEFIDAENLKVDAANIVGELVVGQLPEGVATLDDLDDYAKLTNMTTIVGSIVTTGFVNALGITAYNVHLGGLLAVYDGLDSDTVGGYLGYDNGFNSDLGIGMRMNRDGNGAQCVCTDEAARLSYTVYAGNYLAGQSGVICKSTSLTLDAYRVMQLRFGQGLTVTYGIDADSFYPVVANATLGTKDYVWEDIYTKYSSFSDLVFRVEALEDILLNS